MAVTWCGHWMISYAHLCSICSWRGPAHCKVLMFTQAWVRHFVGIVTRIWCSRVTLVGWNWPKTCLVGQMLFSICRLFGRWNATQALFNFRQQLGLHALIESLVGKLLLYFFYLVQDLLTVDFRFRRFQGFWVQLVLHCNWDTGLLLCQVDREDAIDLEEKIKSVVTVTKGYSFQYIPSDCSRLGCGWTPGSPEGSWTSECYSGQHTRAGG